MPDLFAAAAEAIAYESGRNVHQVEHELRGSSHPAFEEGSLFPNLGIRNQDLVDERAVSYLNASGDVPGGSF